LSLTEQREPPDDAGLPPDADIERDPRVKRTAAEEARITSMVSAHFDFVWRSLRRRGLPPHAADDAAQQVFLVASRRIADIRDGAERAFLFHTALRVGSEASRAFVHRREVLNDDGDFADVRDSAPSPEEQVGRTRALELLDTVLAELPEELRTVLVLSEIEGLEGKEIAEMLSIPTGTVASRLRRAREDFQSAVKRLRAREQFQERGR